MAELPILDVLEIAELNQVYDVVPSWDMSSTQLESGPQESFHHQLSYDDLVIAHFLESRAIAYEYCPPQDTTSFFFYTPASSRERWCGIEVPHDVVLVSPGLRDYVTFYPAGFTAIGVMVSNELLDALEILTAIPTGICEKSTNLMIPISKEGRSFIRSLYRVCRSVETLHHIAQDPVAAAGFRERLLDGLVLLLQPSSPIHSRLAASPSRRYGLTRRAIDLVDGRLTEQLSTRDIASELGVSHRVLQYAFKDVLQCSPYEYVLRRKLHAVRNELLGKTAIELKVSQAAMKYGFTELGRFSGRYSRMFGELPSATARRS